MEQDCKKRATKLSLATWCIHKQNSRETSKQKEAAVITAIITDEIVEQELRRVEEWSHDADEEWVKRGEGGGERKWLEGIVSLSLIIADRVRKAPSVAVRG